MRGRVPTVDEATWMARAVQVGCIVCRVHYGLHSPAEYHHIDGKTRPGAHFHGIPLCPNHHRHGIDCEARHKNKTRFEREYGTEFDLYHILLDILDK